MKVKHYIYIIGIVLLTMMSFTSCSSGDDVDDTFVVDPSIDPRTETWNVTIEPEYVLADADKTAHRVTSVKEGVDDKGERIGIFYSDEIDGVILEEGYRYKLQLAAKVSSNQLSNSAYSFKLSKILDKSYIGINQQNKKVVEMEVSPVRVKPRDEGQTWSYEKLCGKIIGTNEKMDMMMGEIYGLDYREFYGKNNTLNRLLVKVSITPSAKPVYEGKQQRIRLLEVLKKDALWKDSVVYEDGDNTESDTSPVTNSQFGDFELTWSYSGKEIGRGILHAESNNTSTFGLYMDVENNMTKFFVDSIFKKPFSTMEPQRVTFDIDNVTYNGTIQYGFVGYSSDAYYYNIRDWKYMAVAKIDGTFYQFLPVPDYEKSSMAYDVKAKQWLGAITIKQVNFSEAYYVPSPPWTEKYLMSPPIKIVFSTTKKIK